MTKKQFTMFSIMMAVYLALKAQSIVQGTISSTEAIIHIWLSAMMFFFAAKIIWSEQ